MCAWNSLLTQAGKAGTKQGERAQAYPVRV
jgi:hypothetical protein